MKSPRNVISPAEKPDSGSGSDPLWGYRGCRPVLNPFTKGVNHVVKLCLFRYTLIDLAVCELWVRFYWGLTHLGQL